MNWSDINIKTYMGLKEYLAPGENELAATVDALPATVGIVAYLNDMSEDEVYDMPLDIFREKVEELSFMSVEPTPTKPQGSYVLNGNIYDVVLDVKHITAGQWIDFQGMDKENYIGLLSCFMIPRGKEYNTYDMAEVHKDIGTMPLPDVLGLCAFFLILYRAYTKALLRYSYRKIPRREKEKRERIKKILDLI